MNTDFEKIVKRVSPKLKGITYRLGGYFTFFDGDDLFQEALVHLWNDFKNGKLDDKNDSYILQGCYFYLKNYLRKTMDRAVTISLEALLYNEDDAVWEEKVPLNNQRSPFEELENKMLLEDIRKSGFTEREKEVFSLCLEGFTVREIGSKLGVSHVRIVKVKSEIRRKLYYFLGGH